MNAYRPLILLLCCCLATVTASAQEDSTTTKAESADEADHAELRALRDALTDAVSKGDTETQLAYADENIVITWPNKLGCFRFRGQPSLLFSGGLFSFKVCRGDVPQR